MKTEVKALIVTQGVIKASAEMPPTYGGMEVASVRHQIEGREKHKQALEAYREKALPINNESFLIENLPDLYTKMSTDQFRSDTNVYPVEDKGIVMEVDARCKFCNYLGVCTQCEYVTTVILSFQKQEQAVQEENKNCSNDNHAYNCECGSKPTPKVEEGEKQHRNKKWKDYNIHKEPNAKKFLEGKGIPVTEELAELLEQYADLVEDHTLSKAREENRSLKDERTNLINDVVRLNEECSLLEEKLDRKP